MSVLSGELELLGVGIAGTVGGIADMHRPVPDTSVTLKFFEFLLIG